MNHISLFSGIGGIDIAVEWAGFETVLFVEKDDYCQKVLKKHWNVPIIGDIRDVTREAFKETITNTASQRRGSLQRREGEQQAIGIKGNSGIWRQTERGNIINQPITLITGGFPCQPVSVAGKRKGKADDRWLWPEMLRVIKEFKPTWVVGENVAGIRGMDITDSLLDLDCETSSKESEEVAEILDGICTDLERVSYEVQPFLIPACSVNAPHRRYRVFIVAHSTGKGRREKQNQDGVAIKALRQAPTGELGRADGSCDVSNSTDNGCNQHDERSVYEGEKPQDIEQSGDRRASRIEGCSKDVADTNNAETTRQRGYSRQIYEKPESERPDIRSGKDWWATEPELGRVAHGIPHRVDRLKCLGNAVVPQQIFPILKAIAEIERAK